MTAVLDLLLLVLAVVGAVFGAAMLCVTAAWFVVRGVRARTRVPDGDEADDLWV